MNLLFVGTTWPEYNATAAGLRAWKMLEAFKSREWKIAFTTPAKKNAFAEKLRDLGHLAESIPPNDTRFDELLSTFKPDVVIFDRFPTEEQFSWRVAKNLPNALRVLDTVDLHFLRRFREQAVEAGETVVASLLLRPRTEDAIRELSSIHRSDLSLLCSPAELEILKDYEIRDEQLHFLPLLYPEPTTHVDRLRAHFVSIGNFRHPPNVDATHWLKREIWPMIREKLPEAELHIYGAYPPKSISDLTNVQEGFLVMGPAEDQFKTLAQYRVNLAPLRFGAGLKGKIADGWWCGTPVVATAVGAEGMCDGSEFGGSIANDAKSFAAAAVRLYEDANLRATLSQTGLRTLKKHYLADVQTERLIERISNALRELPALRQRNLTGAMLWLHAHRSTEYFSRWIELKNAR